MFPQTNHAACYPPPTVFSQFSVCARMSESWNMLTSPIAWVCQTWPSEPFPSTAEVWPTCGWAAAHRCGLSLCSDVPFCAMVVLILLPRLRWQTWQFSIWPSAPYTCGCLICPGAFFSRMIPLHCWWGFALRSALSPWTAAATSPSKTWKRKFWTPTGPRAITRACLHTGWLPWPSSHLWSFGSTATTIPYFSLERWDPWLIPSQDWFLALAGDPGNHHTQHCYCTVVVSAMFYSDHFYKHLQTLKTQEAALYATEYVDSKHLSSSVGCLR